VTLSTLNSSSLDKAHKVIGGKEKLKQDKRFLIGTSIKKLTTLQEVFELENGNSYSLVQNRLLVAQRFCLWYRGFATPSIPRHCLRHNGGVATHATIIPNVGGAAVV
jgi:hypothetical protein